MHTIPFLLDFVVIVVAAVAVVLVCHRLRVPTVVGFLLTGVLIGPSGLGLVGRTEQVEVFAEIGVVALLFTVGLEFSLGRLREIRRAFFAGGSLQAAFTLAAAVGVAAAAGVALPRAVFLGFLLTLSSTAIVFRLLADRRELESPHGKVAVGVLLFQDFLIVPMMVLTPLLGRAGAASPGGVAGRLAIGAGAAAAVFAVARYLMPRLLYQIVRTRSREVLVLATVGVCLGLAVATEALGFSLALGAFVAGIILSESDYSHQVVAEMLPFRDVFNSLFFISIGMLLDLRFVAAHPLALAALTAGIVALKAAVVVAVVRVLAYPARTALSVGFALAQVGEFSFVLAQVGRGHGLLDDPLYQAFIAAAVLSMLATPALVAAAPRLAAALPSRRRPAGEPAAAGLLAGAAGATGHVVVVGFGVSGRNLARVLRKAGIPYLVVELNGEAVRAARREGEPIVYGDAARREILAQARLATAEAVVFAISDPVAVRRAVATARALSPRLHILVRTRRLDEIDDLYRHGADEVIAEEFETSIEIFTRVLARFGVARNVVEAETRILRGDSYRILRTPASEKALSEKLINALAAGTTAVFFLEPGSAAAGKTIRTIDLRRRAGASIIAVVRDGEARTNPPADLALAAGDSLVLVGSHAEVRAAFDLLGGRA
jgi:CPA2 family monovalent cation:H+ antiporter-2